MLTKLSNSKSKSPGPQGITNECEVVNTISNGITEPLKNMMENLVKPIIEGLQNLHKLTHQWRRIQRLVIPDLQ